MILIEFIRSAAATAAIIPMCAELQCACAMLRMRSDLNNFSIILIEHVYFAFVCHRSIASDAYNVVIRVGHPSSVFNLFILNAKIMTTNEINRK